MMDYKSNPTFARTAGLIGALALMIGSFSLSFMSSMPSTNSAETTKPQPAEEPRTILVCASPFDLREARIAYDNAKWLQSLNCARVAKTIPMTKLENSNFGIKVRIAPNSSAGGLTVWTSYEDYDKWIGRAPAEIKPTPGLNDYREWKERGKATIPPASEAPRQPGTIKICKGNDNCTSFPTGR